MIQCCDQRIKVMLHIKNENYRHEVPAIEKEVYAYQNDHCCCGYQLYAPLIKTISGSIEEQFYNNESRLPKEVLKIYERIVAGKVDNGPAIARWRSIYNVGF